MYVIPSVGYSPMPGPPTSMTKGGVSKFRVLKAPAAPALVGRSALIRNRDKTTAGKRAIRTIAASLL